jgi:ATP-dependent helicase HrpB
MSGLPIDDHLSEVVANAPAGVVLIAPPGTGKTTRVPGALAEANPGGDVIVVEPRRIAARLAATFVARSRGESVGESVGYEVRFDRAIGPRTKIRFVTDGVFARQLTANPELAGVAAVIIDEFHERRLATDAALARVVGLRRGSRQDLRLVAMSATLDPDPLASYLGARVISVASPAHPVEMRFRDDPRDWPLEKRVSAALRDVFAADLDGDVLVFLPGARAIRRAQAYCSELCAARGYELVTLHGGMKAREQDRAVRIGQRPKVILSTNVAETSVTIEGVVAVVDSGLVKRARHSPWTGMVSLETGSVSRASADQRAGRAGRVRPGLCIRLYRSDEYRSWPASDAPEVVTSDLSALALDVLASGARLDELPWFESPPEAAMSSAYELLQRLKFMDDDGITAAGRRAASVPAHPRLARLVQAAVDAGIGHWGCAAAAVLERLDGPPGGPARHTSPSDVLDRVDDFIESAGRGEAGRSYQHIARAVGLRGGVAELKPDEDALAMRCVLAAFPDRVAVRRPQGDLLLSNGASMSQGRSSAVRGEWMVVADEGASICSEVEPDWILEDFMDDLDEVNELRWNGDLDRVERVRQLRYSHLVLESSTEKATGAAAEAVLVRALRKRGLEALIEPSDLESLRNRLQLAADHSDHVVVLSAELEERVVVELAAGQSSLRGVRKMDPAAAILRLCDPRRELHRLAPKTVSLPGRKKVPVHYEVDRPPWIESRLQDFFGLAEGPRIVGGRVPLVLHLQAPNRRAVQVTSDLSGFWQRHYPDLRKQLKRRYPKHRWPEDPMTK